MNPIPFLKNKILILYFLFFCGVSAFAFFHSQKHQQSGELKLYWFVPDGLRAEPEVFKIYEWAQAGELPNLKKLMDSGSYGYSRPVFPSHTPVNFATLMTGSSPAVHGVADGAMRIEGYPLAMAARGGFSSVSKRVPSIWSTLEANKFLVSLLSVPGSTPPELSRGNTIKGRWGAWGLEFPAIIFHDQRDLALREKIGANKRVFTFGMDLTRFHRASAPQDWKIPNTKTFSEAREIRFENWGATIFGLVLDSTNDNKENYDTVLFSKDKKEELARVKEGEWSSWLPIQLNWQTKNDYNINTPKKSALEQELSTIKIDSSFKATVIKLGKKDFFRIRFLYDGNNMYSTQPPELSEKMAKALGPMVDFVDNYPPQLIYFREDKATFLAEAEQSLNWHKSAVSFLKNDLNSEVVIQSIYTPNQMLTSRWWLPYLDPMSPKYKEVDEETRAALWIEMKHLYKKIDEILGEVLRVAGKNSYIVFGSDHGALPLYKEVRLNNLFAKKGWLKFKYNSEREEYEIDWPNTKVVFLQMDNVYISTKGLGGEYQKDSGPEYELLRQQVADSIAELIDPSTKLPALTKAWKREQVQEELLLPPDRVGDLVISNAPPFLWAEDISPDLNIFEETLRGGYKQGIDVNNPGLLTPFVIAGPGVRAGYPLKEVIHHVDQYPTILEFLGQKIPAHATGKVLQEIKE